MSSDEWKLGRRSVLRAAGLGLGAVALPGALTACTGAPPAAEQSPAGLPDVPQRQLGPETDGVPYPKDYVGPRASRKEPIHDGSRTFRVVVPQDAQNVGDWNKNAMTTWFQERTGVKVEFEAVLITGPNGTDLTKVNAMLASGELPDAFLGIPFTDDQISLYGQQGTFVALDDLIETYAPEARRMFAEYPDWRGLTTAADGRRYQLRGINDCYHCRVGEGRAFVNRRYVDAVGGAMPKTTAEFRELLQLFKAKDPSGTGKIIPFTGSASNSLDRLVMNAFLDNPGGTQSGGWIRLVDGRVDFVADKPEWREGLRFLRSLADDGTLTREAFTLTDQELLEAGNQGRLGAVRAYYWGQFVEIDYQDGARWRDYAGLPPLEGPAGVRFAAWDHFGYGGELLVITSACSDPAILVQWADAQIELEAATRASSGVKGENWDWAEPGDKSLVGDQAINKIYSYPAPAGTGWSYFPIIYNSSDLRLAQFSDPKNPNFEADLYQVTTEYEPFAAPKESQLPPLIFDEATAAQKADTAVSIESHVKQHLAKFAIGELDINDDAAWNGYTETLQAMGLTGYLDLHQQAYDARPR
ncbi:hypothetical protein [Microlunatus sp. GCM10028923]|uniref:hypothetical protein n=1 Tax=Microlunatus sp. GCM10028923 TaxID=3273400 RepID=UPI003616D43A